MNKCRIIIDTNVLVSALVFSSYNFHTVVTFAQKQGIILTSLDVLSELSEVLNRQKFDRYLTREIRDDFLTSLALASEIVPIIEKVSVCRDPKDDKFLELIVNGKADFLITGDQDLLALHPFRDASILTVQDFLQAVN
ncbi:MULTISPECIES: putative toxin-antitoxin system toxin component, PIN family [Cyanophyceae]|uniref:putative toxin-antitoxin system toxin component, PIN family n=1 Tax=Cyanophyceae TaxID=3028117 RepID=UPI00016DC80A|nr:MULTISPECIES: putative toxin-antitoxin system toxin component, PIN family [Cyanophyceae]ACA98823.1 PIN domain protein [Picosynechococcus sp. PCC 7002]SMH38293.1 putative toxin-antitoxin system toxin component, PIN family [Picosynechococcus sp. OG1]SMQ77987.1 putative toxin-antitoxin system toxin component, PIN family [Synechococcus sp. 7002]